MQKIHLLKIFLFCIMIYACALLMLLWPDQKKSIAENRELAQKPAFHAAKFLHGSYQKQYESYLNDQFPGRDQWVSMAGTMQTVLGKKEMNGVYFGKNQYLLEKWQEEDFDPEQVTENTEILSDFLNESAEMYGQEHVSCIMVPAKTVALAEHLPKYAETPDHTKVIRDLRDQLFSAEALVDLQEVMQAHQKEYIYYRTDHHWTTLGAYYGYHAWAGQSGQAAAYPLEHYERETVFRDFYGTTYNKVRRGGKADQVELFHHAGDRSVQLSMDSGKETADSMYFPKEAAQGFDRYQIFFSGNVFQIELTTQAKTGKTLLLIKDSFANCFVPFLTEDYDRIIMIDYRYGKQPMGSIMDQYEDITDVLVLFNTEKFMQNTRLGKLSDLRRGKQEKKGMEEFRLEDFVSRMSGL